MLTHLAKSKTGTRKEAHHSCEDDGPSEAALSSLHRLHRPTSQRETSDQRCPGCVTQNTLSLILVDPDMFTPARCLALATTLSPLKQKIIKIYGKSEIPKILLVPLGLRGSELWRQIHYGCFINI